MKGTRFRARTKLWANALILVWAAFATAQDLAPRAYSITPLHTSAITLTWSFYNGGLNFNGTVPITGATGTSFARDSRASDAVGVGLNG